MLEEYLGLRDPNAAYFEVSSLNTPAPCEDANQNTIVADLIDNLPSLVHDIEAECDKRQRINHARDFVDTLSVRLKTITKMYFWEDMSQTRIACTLGISQSAVSQHITKVIALGRIYFGVPIH